MQQVPGGLFVERAAWDEDYWIINSPNMPQMVWGRYQHEGYRGCGPGVGGGAHGVHRRKCERNVESDVIWKSFEVLYKMQR